MKSLKFGNVRLKNRLFLAPMVDVTDMAYRLLCRKAGAAIGYTEMIYVDAILHENAKTRKMLMTCEKDRPVGLQITGDKVSEFKKLISTGETDAFDVIDLNCGCPSIRITGNKAGSYLMESPEKIGKMIRVLKDSGKTVTAKIRLGFKKHNALRVAKHVERAGADLLTVHARLSNQGKSIPADWNWFSNIKKEIGIPIVGNGDIFSGQDAATVLDICDGAMIARGAIGNPLLFREIIQYLRTGKEQKITQTERIGQLKTYVQLASRYDLIDMARIKYLGTHFLKDFSGAAQARERFTKLKDVTEIKQFVKDLEQK